MLKSPAVRFLTVALIVVSAAALYLARSSQRSPTPVETAAPADHAESRVADDHARGSGAAAPRPTVHNEGTTPSPTLPHAQRAAGEGAGSQAASQAENDEPIPFPKNLEKKYLREALLVNVARAFDEAGLKPHESAADCSEYPCIVCTSLNQEKFSSDDLAKLTSAKALDAYEGSDSSACVRVAKHDANGKLVGEPASCLSFRPKTDDEALEAKTNQRQQRRMTELCGGI
jgi:hypothetical protein